MCGAKLPSGERSATRARWLLAKWCMIEKHLSGWPEYLEEARCLIRSYGNRRQPPLFRGLARSNWGLETTLDRSYPDVQSFLEYYRADLVLDFAGREVIVRRRRLAGVDCAASCPSQRRWSGLLQHPFSSSSISALHPLSRAGRSYPAIGTSACRDSPNFGSPTPLPGI